MPRLRSVSMLLLLVLFACGRDAGPPSDVDRTLLTAGACKDAAVLSLLGPMFDAAGERAGDKACGEAVRLASKGQAEDARIVLLDYLTFVLQLYADDQVSAAGGLTVEESIVALFDALTSAIGQAPLPLTPESIESDGVISFLCPSTETCTTATPNQGAAIEFKQQGGVRVIVTVEPRQTYYGGCTAFALGDAHGHDCFDLQLHVEIHPENKIIDEATIEGLAEVALCVVDAPASDPRVPSAEVQARIVGATEEDGELVRLETDPGFGPALLCQGTFSAVDQDGIRGLAQDLARRLFRVRPAYASPGKLGMSLGSFSPVVPIDSLVRTGSITGTVTSVFDEVSGAEVTLFDGNGAVVAQTLTDANGAYVFEDVPIPDASETYVVKVFRNANLSGEKNVTLTPVPPNRDVVLDFDILPPGQQ